MCRQSSCCSLAMFSCLLGHLPAGSSLSWNSALKNSTVNFTFTFWVSEFLIKCLLRLFTVVLTFVKQICRYLKTTTEDERKRSWNKYHVVVTLFFYKIFNFISKSGLHLDICMSDLCVYISSHELRFTLFSLPLNACKALWGCLLLECSINKWTLLFLLQFFLPCVREMPVQWRVKCNLTQSNATSKNYGFKMWRWRRRWPD